MHSSFDRRLGRPFRFWLPAFLIPFRLHLWRVHRGPLLILLTVVAINVAAFLIWKSRKEHRYDAEIRAAATRYELAPALVKAVVWKESRFDPDARGGAGELGLMQLMEETAFEWAGSQKLDSFAHEHVLDPRTNTLAGSYYLAKVLRRYTATDNPLAYALADYNAGRGNVLKWMKGPATTNSAAFLAEMTFPGTRAYIEAVTERYEHYRRDFR